MLYGVKVDTVVNLEVTQGLTDESMVWSSSTFGRRTTKKEQHLKMCVCARGHICFKRKRGGCLLPSHPDVSHI